MMLSLLIENSGTDSLLRQPPTLHLLSKPIAKRQQLLEAVGVDESDDSVVAVAGHRLTRVAGPLSRLLNSSSLELVQ